MTHEKRITRVSVTLRDGDMSDEMAMHVEIEDQGAGEYVAITSNEARSTPGVISINPEEWPLLRETIDEMIARCR